MLKIAPVSLDYCNSVLTGLPRSTTEPLQRVLNAAARLVVGLKLEMGIEPNPNRTNRTRTLVFERTEPN